MSKAGADTEWEEVRAAGGPFLAGRSPGRKSGGRKGIMAVWWELLWTQAIVLPSSAQAPGSRACSLLQQPAPSSACPEQLNHQWGEEWQRDAKLSIVHAWGGTPAPGRAFLLCPLPWLVGQEAWNATQVTSHLYIL